MKRARSHPPAVARSRRTSAVPRAARVDAGADADDREAAGADDAAVHACVLWEAGQLGIAYFDTRLQSLHATSCPCEAGVAEWRIESFRQLLGGREPASVVTSSITPAAFMSLLGTGGGGRGGVPVRVLPRSVCESARCV